MRSEFFADALPLPCATALQPDYRVPAFPTPVSSFAALSYDSAPVDPLRRILRAYDRAIDACESFDTPASQHAISLLRRALELDTPEARSFDALYAWCESTVAQRDFVGAARCLRSLRAAWVNASTPRRISTRTDVPAA